MTHLQDNVEMSWQYAPKTIKMSGEFIPYCFYHNYDATDDINSSNKVLFPESFLNKLSSYDNLTYPITIKLNDVVIGINKLISDSYIYVPDYLCSQLDLLSCETLSFEILNYDIPKATKIKLKPYQSTFYDLLDHKSFLEMKLKKHFTHLKQGSKIAFSNGSNIIEFDILETYPEELVSLIDTDVIVDFDKAHDYVEIEKEKKKEKAEWNPRKWCFKQQRELVASKIKEI